MLRLVENFTVTQSHSRSCEFSPLSTACISSYQYSIVTVLYRFRDKARYWSKIMIFFLSPCTLQPFSGKWVANILRCLFSQPNQIPGLPSSLCKNSPFTPSSRTLERETEKLSILVFRNIVLVLLYQSSHDGCHTSLNGLNRCQIGLRNTRYSCAFHFHPCVIVQLIKYEAFSSFFCR